MSGKIFVSYRRDDASYPAGRLYDRISAVFPQSQIFMDVDNLDPGVDFVEAIQASVSSCDVLIAVIGKRWLVSSDEEGRHRLDNPDDFVRLEIATALKRNIRVIPVLVDGALVPRSTELPDDLKPLVRRNALEVSHERFGFDSGRLADAIKRAFEQSEAEQRQREQKEKPTASSSDVSKRKSPSKRVIAFLAIAAVLVIGGLNYFAIRPSQPPPPRPAPVAAAIPSPTVITTVPVEKKAPTTPEVAAQPSAQPTAPVAAAIPSPTVITTAPVEKKAPTTPGIAVQPSAQPTAPVTLVTPTPATIATPSAQEQAQRYLDMKDFAKALPHLQKAADADDPIAMNKLGVLYENGQGVTQDYGKAREWYQKAADAGNADAMVGLGVLYENGQGVTQDYGKAREWYQKAADAGDPIAMDNLAVLEDADAGDSIAVDNLPVLDRDGLGGAQDSKRPPTPPTRPTRRTPKVPPKITPKRESGTKKPPMSTTQVRSNQPPARAQDSSHGYPGNTDSRGIPTWLGLHP
jgi:Sel1 repeat/TIR domain